MRVRVGERLWLRRLKVIRNAKLGHAWSWRVMEMEDDLLELVLPAVGFAHT
jgi:hypothetical protein